MAAKRQGGVTKPPARHNVVDGMAAPQPKSGKSNATKKAADTSHNSVIDGLARPQPKGS